MNKQIKRLGIFLVICYLAVFAKLHQTQLFEVDELAQRPDNTREVQKKLNRPRGMIVSADGAILARSINVGGNMVPRRREYPEGDLFGHITGYFSGRYGSVGVEKTYDEQLSGDTMRQQFDGLTNLFAARENVGHVSLTVRRDLQQVAREALGDREGVVTVLDPRTGAVLAMWSNPSFHPGVLTEGSDAEAQRWWALMNNAPGKPMLSKAFRDRYSPGSTFKPVVAGVGLDTGKVTLTQPVYPTEPRITPTDATEASIPNFAGRPCGGALVQIMTVSCNTAFARMAAFDIGGATLEAGAAKFGFGQVPPFDLPDGVSSKLSDNIATGQARVMQTAIGQLDTQATPLQMALVAAAAANNGEIMAPHVMHSVRNQDGTVVDTFRPQVWTRAMSPEAAGDLRTAMLGPVNGPGGTASRIRVPAGFIAGGKTGTAEAGNRQHVWFVGFAGPQNQPPTIAISVVVLNQQDRSEVTGGAVAAPVANTVLNKALEVVGQDITDPSGLIAPPPTTVAPPAPFGGRTTTTRR